MTDKRHRTSMGGVGKVLEQSSWGLSAAARRYGKLDQGMKAKDMSRPQFREDQPLDKNYNSVPVDSWLRGGSERGWPPGKGRK
jgi:hypothetical protein